MSMITRRTPWRLAACALTLALTQPISSAQSALVQPPSRSILISSGKSVTVKIDAGDCKPTWEAASNNASVATVSPTTGNAGNKRNFKITAPKGQFSASTTIDITLTGTGKGCAETETVTIEVFVVMDANAPKHFKSGDKNTGIVGTAKRLKELKKSASSIDKQLNADLKTIVKQLKTGTLPLNEGTMPPFPAPAWAQRLATDCQDQALQQLEDVFVEFIEGMAQDGYSLMSLYGFLSFVDQFIAADFQTGSCGLWDQSVNSGSHLISDFSWRGDDRVKKATAQIESFSAGTFRANPGTLSYEFPISTGGVEPTTAFSYDTAKGKVLKVRKTSSTNYVDSAGGNDHGRIEVKGKAPSAGGSITITYERLDSSNDPIGTDTGDYFQETNVSLNAKCKYKGKAPGDFTTANLRPGQWRVTITQGSGDSAVTTTSEVTIPTGTQGS